jgi:uncharacterized protein (TIGR00299 family) protein
MQVLLFDPFHGAAGDMITGALLGCGADQELVARAMRSVVGEPVISTVSRCGITAIKVDTRASPSRRTLDEVLARCAEADAPREAKAMAARVFERIGKAEERVHGARTHFHEVGADDAVADVVGACTALHSLGVGGVAVLPVTLGRGTVQGTHGNYPVPAPATVYLFEGTNIPTRPGDEEGEFCTPTGAALLAEFVSPGNNDPGAYTVRAVGYGAGTRDLKKTPNVLRAMVVETGEGMMPQDRVDVLETNVDDVSGEVIASAMERLMDAGARDASAIPSLMKKGRAGHLVRVICTPDTTSALAGLMARELGTLGIRCTPAVHRFVAERTVEQAEVILNGQRRLLPFKCGWMGGRVYTLKAEFGPARQCAAELDLPVRDVLQAVTEAGWALVRQREGAADEK